MVRAILKFLNRRTDTIHQSAYLLGFFAIASQLLALVRDRILASLFGAGVILDIYYASFRIPDVIFALVASTVSISVLIPFLSGRVDTDFEGAKKFIHSIFTVFLSVITLISVGVFFLMPFIVKIVFPGFDDPYIIGNTIMLTRIMLLSPIFLGLSNLLASITQLYNKFLVYALSPLFYNLGIIAGAIFLYPQFGLKGLAYGVLLGAFLHFLIQLPAVLSSGFSLKFSFSIDWTEIKRVILVSLPRTITLSSQQITILVLMSLASVIAVGSITVFSLSYNIQSVPLSIIGVSYSLAAFPTLSRLFGSGEKEKFFDHIATSVRHIIFWAIPATVLFIVLRAQVVRTAYGAGEFGWEATRLTAAILALFVISAIAQSLIVLFVRAYYASGNTRTPLIINIVSSSIIIILAFILRDLFQKFESFKFFIESLLKISYIPGSSVVVLPIAYSIGTFLNITLFWLSFQADFRKFGRGIYTSFFQILGASIVAGFISWRFLDVFDNFLDINTLIGIFSQGLLAGIMGIISGVVLLILLSNREIKEIWKALHSKIWKAPVVIPDQEEL